MRSRGTFRAGAGCALAVILSLAMASPALAQEEKADTDRPNILFIYTDDQGPWALGRSGHPYAETPTMDRLAEQGAYLPNSFADTPVCSPVRAALMTSRYGTEVGITDWIHPRQEPELGLDSDWVTWPELLSEAGYTNALFGKWHLGTQDRHHPTEFGFDHFFGFREGGRPPENPRLEAEGELQRYKGFTDNIVTDHALEYLNDPANREQPFLVAVHYRYPHARWRPMPEEDWTPFEDLAVEPPHPDIPKLDTERVIRITREYLGAVHNVDRNVSRLLAALDEHGLAENTVVIFTSDHGYNVGHHGVLHKGNGHWILTDLPPATENIPQRRRPNMYDTSLRVPTIVRWPGEIEPGTVIEQTTTTLDWFPTLLEMANIEPPDDLLLRGRSFAALLRGESVPDWDNDLYAEYAQHRDAKTQMRVYRTPEWKLMRDFLNEGRDELYHLAEDPEERENLIDSDRPDVRAAIERLDAKILENMRAVDDPALDLALERE